MKIEEKKIKNLLELNNEIKNLENQIKMKKVELNNIEEYIYTNVFEKNDIENMEIDGTKIKKHFYIDGKIKKTDANDAEIQKIEKIIELGYGEAVCSSIVLTLPPVSDLDDLEKYKKLKEDVVKKYQDKNTQDISLSFSVNFMKLRSILTNEYKTMNKEEGEELLRIFDADFVKKVKISKKKEI